MLPLGRPGPRLSGSCCEPPLDAVVVVVVVVVEDEEAAEPSFFRRIRAKGPATARGETTLGLGRGISCSGCAACLGSQLNSCSAKFIRRAIADAEVNDTKTQSWWKLDAGVVRVRGQ